MPKLEDTIITTSIVFDELNKVKTDKSPGPEGWPYIYSRLLRTTINPMHYLFCLTSPSSVVFRHLNGELPLLPLFIRKIVSILLVTTDQLI